MATGALMTKKPSRNPRSPVPQPRYYSPSEVQRAETDAYNAGRLREQQWVKSYLMPFVEAIGHIERSLASILAIGAVLPGLPDRRTIHEALRGTDEKLAAQTIAAFRTALDINPAPPPEILNGIRIATQPVIQAVIAFLNDDDWRPLYELAQQQDRLIGQLAESRQNIKGGRPPGMTEWKRWLGARVLELHLRDPEKPDWRLGAIIYAMLREKRDRTSTENTVYGKLQRFFAETDQGSGVSDHEGLQRWISSARREYEKTGM